MLHISICDDVDSCCGKDEENRGESNWNKSNIGKCRDF